MPWQGNMARLDQTACHGIRADSEPIWVMAMARILTWGILAGIYASGGIA